MDYMNLEKTGALIAAARKEKALTQLQLAEKLGVTDRAVSKWERGKAFPDVSMLKPLCRELDLSVSELLDGERKEVPMTAEETEDVVIKGIRSYEKKAEKENLRNWVMTALVLLLGIAVFCAARYSVRPADFQTGDYNLNAIGLNEGEDGIVRYRTLSEEFDDELKTQIQTILLDVKDSAVAAGSKAPRTNFISLENVGYFCEDGYYDLRSKKFYYFTGSYSVYQRLYDVVKENLPEKGYNYNGKKSWTFENPERHFRVYCKIPDAAAEKIVSSFMDDVIGEPRFEEYPDAYISDSRIKSIRRLPAEEYEQLSVYEYDYKKEIAYRELYEYRIYEVIGEKKYTEALKKLGPQWPEGERTYYFLVGKSLSMPEWDIYD